MRANNFHAFLISLKGTSMSRLKPVNNVTVENLVNNTLKHNPNARLEQEGVILVNDKGEKVRVLIHFTPAIRKAFFPEPVQQAVEKPKPVAKKAATKTAKKTTAKKTAKATTEK